MVDRQAVVRAVGEVDEADHVDGSAVPGGGAEVGDACDLVGERDRDLLEAGRDQSPLVLGPGQPAGDAADPVAMLGALSSSDSADVKLGVHAGRVVVGQVAHQLVAARPQGQGHPAGRARSNAIPSACAAAA